jgi:WD40 repeat protein
MVCQSGEDLKVAASWDGTHGSSRQKLLTELSSKLHPRFSSIINTNQILESIAPSIMIPNNRLAVLLDQVKYNQISRCHWHNPTTLPSLFQDHLCDRSQFPLQTVKELAQNDEVYFVAFSHDGRRLATCGKDHSIIIYDTTTFQEKYVLLEHHASVSFLAWSPDDTKLLSCSVDKRVIGWDVVVSIPGDYQICF